MVYDPPYPPVVLPDASLQAWAAIKPRPLLPISPPPPPSSQTNLPKLPIPQRQSPFSGWELTTHIIPAASPRTVPLLLLPTLPVDNISKRERKQQMAEVGKDVLENKLKQVAGEPGFVKPDEESKLWVVVNRFRRLGAKGGKRRVTLFFAHANGFHKESWEATISHLLRLPSATKIDEIWTWDASNHGDSALLNLQSNVLGGVFDWADNSRDILNFLLYYLPTSPLAEILPTHLAPVSLAETASRMKDGWKERTLVGVGHSYGGATTLRAAIDVPTLFSSLILVDPVIFSPHLTANSVHNHVLTALSRRHTWPSTQVALDSFKQNPFFQVWDENVLRSYAEHGTVRTGNGEEVRLKQGGLLEAITFAEVRTPQEAGALLPFLSEKVELFWVMPGVGKPNIGGDSEELVRERVWRRPRNCGNVRIKGAGHLIPQEKPKELAHAMNEFLERKYGAVKALL